MENTKNEIKEKLKRGRRKVKRNGIKLREMERGKEGNWRGIEGERMRVKRTGLFKDHLNITHNISE